MSSPLSPLVDAAQEARYPLAVSKISDLATAIERHEPMNAPLFLRAAQPLARLAGRHAGVLQLTMGMVDKARRIEPQKAEYAGAPRLSAFPSSAFPPHSPTPYRVHPSSSQPPLLSLPLSPSSASDSRRSLRLSLPGRAQPSTRTSR